MTYVDESIGKIRPKKSEANPRDLFRQILADNPKLKKEKLRARYWDAILDEDNIEYLETLVNRDFDRHFYEEVEHPAEVEKRRAEREELTKTRAAEREKEEHEARAHFTKALRSGTAQIKKTIKAKATLMLFNLKMPNGKRMGKCSREELMANSSGTAKIARHMKPGQILEKAMTERKAIQLYNS